MHKFVWALQIILALFFVMPGFTKLTTSREELVQNKQLEPDQPDLPIRMLGGLELLGSIGMILPMLLKVRSGLTPLAALGFCLVMIGAVVVHASRGEYNMLPLLGAVFLAAATVAWYRFRKVRSVA